FLWDPVSQSMQDIGTLEPNDGAAAQAINLYGEVVGYTTVSLFPAVNAAFVWDSVNLMRDLNTLIDPTLGWQLQVATAINDKGQIVGYGLLGGQQHSFLLTPPARLDGLSIDPNDLTAGNSTTGPLSLTFPAGPDGLTANLASDDTTGIVNFPTT